MALEPRDARDFLISLGSKLPRPKAILVVSAHHDDHGAAGEASITSSAMPETVHEFGAFPQALFDMRYPAPGEPNLAARVQNMLSQHGVMVVADEKRGLDHGAWVPLSLIYPNADIPVVQLGS